jgi:hypothetical protein
MSQEYEKEDSFTPEDLMYLCVVIATSQANLDLKHGMPKTYEAIISLKEKVDIIYRKMVND